MTTPIAQASSEQRYEVTPLELFFDLVFAFAISQLSHHLLTDLTWRGTAEVLVMLFAIFGAWLTTSWSATMFRADQSQTRWLIFVVMLLSLFMNASVTRAFTSSGWAFVIPLLLIQLGRAIWMLNNSTDAIFRDHYIRVLIWLIITTHLWIVGASVNSESRLLWWALAAVIDQIGRWFAHPVPGRRLRSENIPFDAEHLLERCRLFLIIALGETVFTTGAAIVAEPITLITLITGTFALVATIALWALNFERSARLNLHYREEATDPIRIARYAGNALIVMVAGLIGIAVANEIVIAHPYETSSAALNLLLFGCPILYLIAQGWYLQAVPHNSPRLRLIRQCGINISGDRHIEGASISHIDSGWCEPHNACNP
jgi:low temperature requirement protein LtrA